MSAAPFSKDTPDKIVNGIDVSGKNTLISTTAAYNIAIADEPIDAKVDGKKMFCVRVDENAGSHAIMMIGFTPRETFHSTKEAFFGYHGFTGCGIFLFTGDLRYPVDKHHNIINNEISDKAKEVIVILTISNNGKKKEIRFLCDGHESKSKDVSKHLEGDFLFPAIVLGSRGQQVTTIPLDQLKTRTPEIEELIKEYQQQQQRGCPLLQFVSISDFFLQKYPLLQQHEELGIAFLQQREVLFRGLMARMKLEIEAKQ